MDDAQRAVKENQLASVGGLWATGIAASLLYNYSRPIPQSLKLIHSCGRTEAEVELSDGCDRRIYAQVLTVGALVASAAVELYAARGRAPAAVDSAAYTPHAKRGVDSNR